MISETTIVAIIAAIVGGIPPTIFALAAFRKGTEAVSVGKEAVAESKKTTEKADVIIGKAEELHVLTNGNLHKVTESLAVANEKIVGLEKLISTMLEHNNDKET